MNEIKELRQYTRMPNSINNHSKRCYEYGGAFYLIDRETDTSPKSYRIYAIYGDPRVREQGLDLISDYWGNNISWKKAEIQAVSIIDKWIKDSESL
jgi:hypothetical protein